jgi:hypothetical protein
MPSQPAGSNINSAWSTFDGAAPGAAGTWDDSSSPWPADWGEYMNPGDWGEQPQVVPGQPGSSNPQQQQQYQQPPNSTTAAGAAGFDAGAYSSSFSGGSSSSSSSSSGYGFNAQSAGAGYSTGFTAADDGFPPPPPPSGFGSSSGYEQKQQQQASWPFADTTTSSYQQGAGAGASSQQQAAGLLPSDITLIGRRDAVSLHWWCQAMDLARGRQHELQAACAVFLFSCLNAFTSCACMLFATAWVLPASYAVGSTLQHSIHSTQYRAAWA